MGLKDKYRHARRASHTARTRKKRRYWKARARFWLTKLQHRKEMRELRSAAQPKFQPWMANGYDWRGSCPQVRRYIARAVAAGLTCTSLKRNFIPPGGSTTSLHLSGRAGDAAGSADKMAAFQLAEYDRDKGHSVELFGPSNDVCLVHGAPYTMPEGSPLETLHDTHVHKGWYA